MPPERGRRIFLRARLARRPAPRRGLGASPCTTLRRGGRSCRHLIGLGHVDRERRPAAVRARSGGP
eukprot:3554853-Prymnesium_polylepis.1